MHSNLFRGKGDLILIFKEGMFTFVFQYYSVRTCKQDFVLGITELKRLVIYTKGNLHPILLHSHSTISVLDADIGFQVRSIQLVYVLVIRTLY